MTAVKDDRRCFGCGCDYCDEGSGGDCCGGDGSSGDDSDGRIVGGTGAAASLAGTYNLPGIGGTFSSTFVIGRLPGTRRPRLRTAAAKGESRNEPRWEEQRRERDDRRREHPGRLRRGEFHCDFRGGGGGRRDRDRRRIVDRSACPCLASSSASTTKSASLCRDPNTLWSGHHSFPSPSSVRTKNADSVYSLCSPGHHRRQERRAGRRQLRRRWRNGTAGRSVAIGTIVVAAILAMTTTATRATVGLLPRVATAARSTAALGGAGRTDRGGRASSASASSLASMATTRCCFAASATSARLRRAPQLQLQRHEQGVLATPRQLSHRALVVGSGNWSCRTQHSSHRIHHRVLSSSRSHRPLSSSPTRLYASEAAPNGEGDGGRGAATDGAATALAARRERLRASTRLSLAPMMDYTDRHFRYLMRLITSETLLYSEMVAANALAHERRARLDLEGEGGRYDDFYLRRFLAQSALAPGEQPSVLQLGGSDPRQLYESARAVLEASSSSSTSRSDYFGGGGVYPAEYTALNLNCGCPSPKVANKGCFGAALMHDPHLVKELCSSMHLGADGTHPVTVKCRIGTDSTQPPDDDDRLYSGLCRFVDTVASGGVVTDFQIHARIAVLGRSMSPAKNRSVPPLKYHLVRRLAGEFPELTFTLNGGVDNLIRVKEELEVDGSLAGVMVGRGMAAAPWNWATADEYLFAAVDPDDESDGVAGAVAGRRPRDRWELLEAYGAHADREEAIYGKKIRRFILRALQGVFTGEPNAKKFRVALDEIGGLPKREEEARRLQLQRQRQKGDGGGDGSFEAPPPQASGPPLSELVLRAARDCFSDEVLHRTRAESFEIMRLGVEREEIRMASAASVSMGRGVADGGEGSRSAAVREWQARRKEGEADATEAADSTVAAEGDQEEACEGSGSGDTTRRWVQSS